MYTIYINNTLSPALAAVHEIYRDIFGPPMVLVTARHARVGSVKILRILPFLFRFLFKLIKESLNSVNWIKFVW